MDENGIPQDWRGRVAIARRILDAALAHGIAKEDVFIDCLTLTVSAQQEQAVETLRAVRAVKEELGLHTVLGVSNISFGLPARETITRSFLTQAMYAGLDLPIVNPNQSAMMDAVAAFRVLSGQDRDSEDYIRRFAAAPAEAAPVQNGGEISLSAACAGFDLIKTRIAKRGGNAVSKGKIVLATVQGDIHDIGKNIVRVVLENYGYTVVDLGRDVPPQTVVEAAIREDAKLVGLSALMTTTVKSMAETIEALRKSGHDCRIMVGGAVLTEEYAAQIGADYYAKDAKQSADIARKVLG